MKKLNKILESIINEDIAIVDVDGKALCKLQLPNGEIIEDTVVIHGKTRCGACYDSNIYGVEPQYAVGGYELDDNYEELDPNEFEVDDEEYERFNVESGDIKILDILDEKDLEFGDYEVEPYEPDYDEY